MKDVISSFFNLFPVDDFEWSYLDTHLRHSNVLHSRNEDGKPYPTGHLVRLNLNLEQLEPDSQEIITENALELPINNPYQALYLPERLNWWSSTLKRFGDEGTPGAHL